MKSLIPCFLMLSLAAITPAQCSDQAAPEVIDLWPPGRMPGPAADGPEAEKPPTGDGVIRITNVSSPTLTLYRVPGTSSTHPAMIICPGGGYGILAFNKEGSEIAEWLNSIGITALVLKYRVPQNREGAFQDIQRAIRVTRSRAKDWGVDPDRLGVIGFSAGGHLACRASTRFGHPSYEALDAIDRESCRPDFAVLVYPAYLVENGVPAPKIDLSARIPPTLIVHSEDDKKFIAGSKWYAAELQKRGISHQFLLYPTGGHGGGLHGREASAVWPQQAAEWLLLTTRKESAPQETAR